MLHTGTMFAVIGYFWKAWAASYGANRARSGAWPSRLAGATLLTGIVGLGLKKLIE